MTHVLPPKLAGPLAALEAAPNADCLLISHRGLEGLTTPRDFLRRDAVGRKLRVQVQRIASESLPTPAARPMWLFERWKEVDAFAAGVQSLRKLRGNADGAPLKVPRVPRTRSLLWGPSSH